MGIWIVVAVVLFALGSIMALKPSGIEQRLDKLRMSARRLELNPKLIACPDWIRGKDNEYGRGMIAQYAVVLDNMKLPHARYHSVDGHWRPDVRDGSVTANFTLSKAPLALPDTIAPFVKALQTKANSIAIYWEDAAYVRPVSNPHFNSNDIEPDLLALKAQLTDWAYQLNQRTP